MHSAEPIEPRYVNDPCDQTSAAESWRAEVASRVTNYRARRQQPNGDESSPQANSGPASEAPNFDAEALGSSQGSDAQNCVSGQSEKPSGGMPQSPAFPARNAFDTNYYRRLNAEAMAQNAQVAVGSAGAATAPAFEFEAEFQAEAEAENLEEQCNPLPEASDDQALDLEMRPETSEAEDAAEVSFLERYCISEPESQPDFPVSQPVTQLALPAAVAQGNLIVFRRPFLEPPLVPQPSRDELAEPVNRRPRILEVPEDIMPTVQDSLFPEIRLDADEQEETSNYREPEFEVPLRVAKLSERLIASVADMGLVTAAGLLFAAMAWRALPDIPHSKPFFMLLGAVTLVLWALYQQLFLLYAGRTPGMCLRGIRLRTFDGRMPLWKQRSSRANFMFVSFASVALGFLWALVDEDTLCWHDRISKTFLTTE